MVKKMFIVKVQISIFTTYAGEVAAEEKAKRRILVYDEKRERMFEGEADPSAAEVLGDRLKVFFWAEDARDGKINLLGKINLIEEAPWQAW